MRLSAGTSILCILLASAALGAWAADTIDLAEGWRFAPDPENVGLEQGRQQPGFDDSGWAVIDAGTRWEEQGYPDVDGYAWYRKTVRVPADMGAPMLWLNLGGINDSGTVYCNGREVATFGDHESVSVAARPVAAVLNNAIHWGEDNVIAIRVFDWGGSGGLQRMPCNITTNADALAVQSSLTLVPGLDGAQSIVGFDLSFLNAPADARACITAAVGTGTPTRKEAGATVDRGGNPIAVAAFDLIPDPGDTVTITAQVIGDEGAAADMVFTREYVWPGTPQWPGEYSGLKVLNNFVTELKALDGIAGQSQRGTFLNPREGWVFFRSWCCQAPSVYLGDEVEPLVWRQEPESGAFEAMRRLPKGEHAFRLENTADGKFEIRAVPELAFCYWPTRAVLQPLPPRDRAFAQRRVFPNVNTLLTHDDMEDELFESWRAEGRAWLNNSSLPGLHDDTAPTADFVYDKWINNAVVTRDGYAGLIVDEFLTDPADYYAAWTEAVERLHAAPEFDGKTFYAWVVDIYDHPPALAFMKRLYDLGGNFAWERYLHEEPTEELALLSIYDRVARQLNEWEQAMPGIRERTTMCLGSFTTPWCSLNINPGVNYIAYMDDQFRVLATDPTFFSTLGVFQWAAHYTDDDVLRYAMKLYRHYGIEGNRTPYADFAYAPGHVANPDFADALDGWRADPAAPESIVGGEHRGLGKIQGRWTEIGYGDKCAVMVRSQNAPNRLSQTLKGLEPGRLYSMKYIAADLDSFGQEQKVGLWAQLDGAEFVPERSFRYAMPSSYALDLEGFDRQNRAYTTYCQIMFRPTGTTVELTFTDWRDGAPGGPAGQRIGFNFVEVLPYFEE